MHYKNDVNRASLKIGDNYKGVFKNICHEMCSVTTIAEYNDRKKRLEEIADIFPQITSWINWWDARKYHIFPAFRWLGYSNVTLAESGNSTLKRCTQLWLLEAAHDDTSTMITQIHELEAFLSQQTASSGRGPCSQSCGRADIEIQMHARLEHMQQNSTTMRPVLPPYRKVQTQISLYHPVVQDTGQ